MSNHWHRKLWGVEFRGTAKETPKLIGDSWHAPHPIHHPGEPTRALLFTTRQAALAWCETKSRRWREYPPGHPCREWRVRPVRVVETVRKETL